jgi:hypothetical protein
MACNTSELKTWESRVGIQFQQHLHQRRKLQNFQVTKHEQVPGFYSNIFNIHRYYKKHINAKQGDHTITKLTSKIFSGPSRQLLNKIRTYYHPRICFKIKGRSAFFLSYCW